jgi:predicted DsbA family dithiol-disulfide isomerase
MTLIEITHFTDPNCPFAFASERQRLQLLWYYGPHVRITSRMILLSEDVAGYIARGFTPEMMAGNMQRLFGLYGMPFSTEIRDRLGVSVHACRAYVGARTHRPERAEALLRALRVRQMGGEHNDLPEVIAAAAADAELTSEEVLAWLEDSDIRAATYADRDAARSPHPAAVALRHKLAPWDGGLRYTAPSLELRCGEREWVLPGMQPWESWEVAIANLAPSLPRRAAPETAREVLEWAPFPLATAEIAAIRGVSAEEARVELDGTASFTEMGADGYWSLVPVAR